MCLGVPGRIVEVTDAENELVLVEVDGVRRTVNVGLVGEETLVPGDWVLIHVGFVLSKIDEDEARATLAFLAAMSDPFSEELDGLFESRIE